MKLHWRTYWYEYIGEHNVAWLPCVGYTKSPLPFFFKEIAVSWLRWGFAFRWWWR